MKKLEYIIAFFSLSLAYLEVQAGMVVAVSEKIFDLDNIEHRIFTEFEITMMSIPTENEWKAQRGMQYLYCSAVADVLGQSKESKKNYIKGMELLDFYASDFVVDSYLNNPSRIAEMVSFYSSKYHLIDQKDVFKGVLAANLFSLVDGSHVPYGKYKVESTLKFQSSYERRCKK